MHTSIIIYFTTNCLVTKSGLHLKICANSRREYKYYILSTKAIFLTAMKQLKLRISTFVNKKKLYKVFYNLNRFLKYKTNRKVYKINKNKHFLLGRVKAVVYLYSFKIKIKVNVLGFLRSYCKFKTIGPFIFCKRAHKDGHL